LNRHLKNIKYFVLNGRNRVTIRPDKCFAYAAAQRNGKYQQIKPSLSVNGNDIPTIEIGSSMTYLGQHFSFASDSDLAKAALTCATKEAINSVHQLPITPLLKCHALNLKLRAALSFLLSHNSISLTWIKLNLDNLVTIRIRQWLDLPPCATAHYIPLPTKSLGLDVILPSMLSELRLTSSSLILAHSKDPKIKNLYQVRGCYKSNL